MALIVILICLGIQRFAKFNSYSHQLNWVEPYFTWLTTKFGQITKGHGFIGVAILVLPVLIGVAVVFALTYSLLGIIGYAVLSLAILWYCMDGRDIRKEAYEDRTPGALFLTTYRGLFAVIFWFALLGPVGLALYISVVKLEALIQKQPLASPEEAPEKTKTSLQECMRKTLGVLDWVPVRMLGLSYAVVGHFGSVFKSWLKKLSQGVSNTQNLVVEWGMIALHRATATTDTSSAQAGADTQESEAITLIDRSLLVWLIVIFLVSFGVLLG